jgi:uncharacterized membrane protein YfcA
VTLETPLLLSFLAGSVGAMAGVGSGVLLVPELTLAGEDITRAIAVSTLSVTATSSGAASAYVRDHLHRFRARRVHVQPRHALNPERSRRDRVAEGGRCR